MNGVISREIKKIKNFIILTPQHSNTRGKEEHWKKLGGWEFARGFLMNCLQQQCDADDKRRSWVIHICPKSYIKWEFCYVMRIALSMLAYWGRWKLRFPLSADIQSLMKIKQLENQKSDVMFIVLKYLHYRNYFHFFSIFLLLFHDIPHIKWTFYMHDMSCYCSLLLLLL